MLYSDSQLLTLSPCSPLDPILSCNFFYKSLLRYCNNFHTIQPIHLKCTMACSVCTVVYSFSQSILGYFHPFKRKPAPTSSHSHPRPPHPQPLAATGPLSVPTIWPLSQFIYMKLYVMWLFATDFSQSASCFQGSCIPSLGQAIPRFIAGTFCASVH